MSETTNPSAVIEKLIKEYYLKACFVGHLGFEPRTFSL